MHRKEREILVPVFGLLIIIGAISTGLAALRMFSDYPNRHISGAFTTPRITEPTPNPPVTGEKDPFYCVYFANLECVQIPAGAEQGVRGLQPCRTDADCVAPLP